MRGFFAADTCHPIDFDGFLNNSRMVVTLDVSQLPIGWSKPELMRSKKFMVVTLEMSPPIIGLVEKVLIGQKTDGLGIAVNNLSLNERVAQ